MKHSGLFVLFPALVLFPLIATASGTPQERVASNIVPQAAIKANGMIESTLNGFRFPDGTIQSTAATVTGGVPSVNGITSAVTITGAGTTTVSTNASTITINGGGVAYKRTIVVSPIPGDATGSGAALAAALASISDNSLANPYLVRLEPGEYNIGGLALTMKNFVDIEGSGQETTRIVASCGGASLAGTSVAVYAPSSVVVSLRNLRITNVSVGDYGGVIRADTSSSVRLEDVTLEQSAANIQNYGIYATSSGIFAFHAAITSTASATGGATGIYAGAATVVVVRGSTVTANGNNTTANVWGMRSVVSTAVVTIDSSTIVGKNAQNNNWGLMVDLGNVTVTNSTISAEGTGLRTAVQTGAIAGAILRISHSKLLALGNGSNAPLSIFRGSASTLRVATSLVDAPSGGTPTCAYVYDANFAETTCAPPIG